MLNLFYILSLIALAGGLFWCGRELRRLEAARGELAGELDAARRRLREVERELGALCKASAGAGEQVVRLGQQMKRLCERQDQVELRASATRPYGEASRLARDGADIQELVRACGLTPGEAELLVRLAGRDADAA